MTNDVVISKPIDREKAHFKIIKGRQKDEYHADKPF